MIKKTNIFIKIFIAVLIGLAAFSFAACGDKRTDSDSGSVTEAVDSSIEEDAKSSGGSEGEKAKESGLAAESSKGNGSEAEESDGIAEAADGGTNGTNVGNTQTKEKYTAYLSFIDLKSIEEGSGSLLIRNVKTGIDSSGSTLECHVRDIVTALSEVRSGKQTTVVTDEFSVDSVDSVDQTVVIHLDYKGTSYLQTYNLRCLVYQITDSVIHSLQNNGLDYRNVKIETDSEWLLDDEFDITYECFDLDDCDEFAGI